MPNNQYRATWKGPGRDTQEEALADIKLLNTTLEEHAPELYAYATSAYKKDRPAPGDGFSTTHQVVWNDKAGKWIPSL